MIGKTILHYRVLEKLGQGGMGVVYLAEDTRLGRKVALKALTAEIARDPRQHKRFRQEARAAASLTHPGVAAVYALEQDGDDLYIVYEYVPGKTLREVIQAGRLGPEEVTGLAVKAAQAMAAAHKLGIVHRDLKPENIMRTPEGAPKILDFGLARFTANDLETATTQSDALTAEGSIIGTVSYMSPEQLQAQEADFRSDIFSFGVVLYEIATGVRPFEGGSTASTIANIMTAEPLPPSHRNPVSPPELDRIVRKCLRKKREERYQSTQDLVVDLEQLRRDSGETSGRPAAAAEVEYDSLLRRAFSVVATNPRRWWELQHLAALFGFFPFYLYLAWQARAALPPPWDLILYVTALLFAASSMTLRGYLLVSGAFNPRGLVREVGRLSPWLHASTTLFMSILAVTAVWILPNDTHFGSWLLGLSLAGVILSRVMEPTLDRAAFPSAFTKDEKTTQFREEERTSPERDYWVVAAIQTFYILPYIFVLGSMARAFEQFPQIAEQVKEFPFVWGLNVAVVVLVGGFTVGLWQRQLRVVRNFSQFFPLFLLIDFFGAFAYFAILLIFTNIVVAVFLLPIIVWLPFYQRRLARRILEASGEFAKPAVGVSGGEGAGTLQKGLFGWTETQKMLAQILLFQLVYHIGVLLAVAQEDGDGLIEWLGGIPFFAFMIGLGTNTGICWEAVRGKRSTAKLFFRWFPIFVMIDLLGIVLVVGLAPMFLAQVPLAVLLLVIVVLAVARIHQRKLTKQMLEGQS